MLLSVLAENVQVNSTTTLSDALDLIDARIDQIVAPTGSTSALDAEIFDARIGVDGTDHGNLGDAIRNQINDLKTSTDNEISDLKGALLPEGLVDVLAFASPDSGTVNGVTYTFNADGSCTVVGTASSISFRTYYTSSSAIPYWIELGKTYHLYYESENVSFQIYPYKNGELGDSILTTKENAIITIPDDITGLIIRLAVRSGKTVNETVHPKLLTWPKLDELANIDSVTELTKLTQYNYGAKKENSCDDVVINSIYFVSVKNNIKSIPDFPFDSGWLQTLGIGEKLNPVGVFQIAYPYGRYTNFLLRKKQSGTTWTPWMNYEGELDILETLSPENRTINGITYTFNSDGSCTVTGTATSLSFVNYYSYSSSIPYWMDTEKTYYLYYESENVDFQIYPYKNGELENSILTTKENATVVIPNDVTGLIIRLAVRSGKTVNETVHPKLLTKKDNVNKAEKIIYETKYITQDTYNNSYSTTINPTITLDSNGWLQPVDTDTENEDNKTDMTSAIMSMLTENGYCHLAPGIYYVSGNIDMPANSTIIGCGRATTIRLLSSVSSGYCIKPANNCIIKDLSLSGGYSEITFSDGNIEGRNGIYLKGNNRHNILTNCYFYNFSGSAIYQYDTGGSVQGYIYMTNIYIRACNVGINIDYKSEYCKYTNVVTSGCYYACINNGGNNVFVNCTFHGVIGFLIDNSNDDKNNNSHGSAIGCSFNHIDNINHPDTLGGGDAIKIINADNGFIFSGCQLWYGAIKIENSRGISLSNCLIGGGTPSITVTGSYPAFFHGCVFHQRPNISVTSDTKFNNCYLDSDGSTITN